MIELKFRVWDGNNGYYLYPDVIELDRGIEWEQFIGLEDKNKRGIYRNDLFKDSTGVSLVGWNSKFASFCLQRNGWMFDHFFGEAVDPEDGEVVGNIHENPELLEGVK
jgi:uncharacterized phage protein (TIGR01671 family)